MTERTRDHAGINWPTALFLSITPVVGLLGTAWWIGSGQFHGATLVLFFVTWAATAMGITAGYHRLFSHRAYTASRPVQLALIWAGGAAWEGPALEWCRDHRRHHRYVDTERDPYNIREGFWWAHCMWLVRSRPQAVVATEIPDLASDPVMRFQSRHYALTASISSFLLPVALATLWGDPWGGLLFAGALRVVLNHHTTFLINSMCHMVGSQPYSDRHSARDNWVAALLTYGEGYHNFHHEFPSDYRNGVRLHQWDPTKWLIWALWRVGGVRELRRINPEKILAKRMRMDDKRLAPRLERIPAGLAAQAEKTRLAALERVQAAVDQLAAARTQYLALRSSHGRGPQLVELRQRLKSAERELATTFAMWRSTARGLTRMATA